MDNDTRNDTNNTSGTCNYIQEDLIIAKHSRDLCFNFHFPVNNNKKHLPFIKLKLQKDPNKARIIIGTPVRTLNFYLSH